MACTCKTVRPKDKAQVNTEFYADGENSDDCLPITGVMVRSDGTRVPGVTKTPPAPRRWLIYFKVPAGKYRLEIHGAGAKCHEVKDITVTRTKRDPKKRRPRADGSLHFFAGIEVPVNNGDDCCAVYFTAQGPLGDDDTIVSASVRLMSGGPLIDARNIHVDGGSWFADWDPLDHDDYRLDVLGNNGGNDSRINLHMGDYC